MGKILGRVTWQQCKINFDMTNQRWRTYKEETDIPLVTALHMEYLRNKPTAGQVAPFPREIILFYPQLTLTGRRFDSTR